MEKYKTVKAVSVNPLSHELDENGKIILKEKQIMTKEYALSLIHSKRGQLNHVERIAAIKASNRRKFVRAFMEEYPDKEVPQVLPQRLGGYKH